MRSLVLGLLASAAVLGLPSMPACAGSFAISPIRLDLSAAARTAAVTVRNEDREVLVQAEAVLWEQADGEDRLTPTRDLLVSPAVFTLPPNGSQLVRVAIRGIPADGARELSYRLILQEVPQPASPEFTGLQVTLRLSLPVFIAAAGTAGPDVTWSATTADDRLVVTARNLGDVHARIHRFSVAPVSDTETTLAQPVAAYLLPGQSRSWTLETETGKRTAAADWRRLRLKITTDDGESETEIDSGRE